MSGVRIMLSVGITMLTITSILLARKIWSDILASGSGYRAESWIEAATLERFFGEVDAARRLLYKAINSASDHPYTVNTFFNTSFLFFLV